MKMSDNLNLIEWIIIISAIVLVAALSVIVWTAVNKIRKKPIGKKLKVAFIAAIVFLLLSIIVLATVFSGILKFYSKDYREDLYVDIPDTEYQLLIKEWSYLLASGEEVYFVDGSKKKPVHLGDLRGGDDGYCPFANGDYEITYSDGEVYIAYDSSGNKDGEFNKTKSFDLPID